VNDFDAAAVVRDGYDQIADRYLAAVARPRPTDARSIWSADLLQRLASQSAVLDLGCGPGVPSAADFAAAGHRVTGVDISPRQIELARRNVANASFVVDDVMHFSADPASFDAAIALYSLTHVPRDQYATLFARLNGWLRPGGWFLATMGTSDVAGWDEEDFLGFGNTNWTNGYDPDTTRKLLHDAGFELERAEIVSDATPFGPERWFWVLARSRDA
jgi:SAM-dependent methyltransferase